MHWMIFKYAITAGMVVLISEVAKRSDKLGGLIAALPLVTFLTLIWLFIENQSSEKIANHAWYTFWYVIPTLPMFLAFPCLLKRFSFWSTMGISIIVTLVSFYLFAKLVKGWGINLL
jgi:F0F1-type ATP synthase assembly protein I